MSIKNIFYALFFAVVLCVNAESSQDVITLHYPPDKIIKEYGLMGVSFSVAEGSADQIRVNVNNVERFMITPDQKYECFTVNLEPGVNTIELVAYKGNSMVDHVTRDVFRRSDLISKFRTPPYVYERDFFHMGEHEQCTECHTLEPSIYDKKPVSPVTYSTEAPDNEKVIATTSTCYSCHIKIASYPYVHGPASVWSCLSCHDADSSPVYSVKKPDTEMCYSCHVEQKTKWMSKKYTHGPVTMGKCTICHSPHASQYPFYLYKSTWYLCTNCHFEKGTGKHVLGDAFSTEGHPTRDRKDPVRIGKDLTCASCHDSHASDYSHLWAFEVDSIFALCQKCHNK